MSTSSASDAATGSANSNDTVGVQDLINRLKDEGVHEGKQQAEALLAEAKKQAAGMIQDARDEAEKIVESAQQNAERTETNGKRALSLASRDASLQLKEQLEHQFRGWVSGLVNEKFDEPDFLGKLITSMAGQVITAANQDAGDSEPSDGVGFLLAEDKSSSMESYVKAQAAAMLQKGVRLQADRNVTSGFRAQLSGDHPEIDFSEDAVTAALMRFLAPKFRQMVGSASTESADG